MSDATVQDRNDHGAAKPAEPTIYSLRGTQLLSGGMTTTTMAFTDNLWVHSKVYSRGGENDLHAHVSEDHTFFVLQGAAMFDFGGGKTKKVERFEGVLLPKGALYRFQAMGGENLVMLRVGGVQIGADWSGEVREGSPVEIRQALDAHGQPILNNKSRQKGKTPSEPVVPMTGRFFPQD